MSLKVIGSGLGRTGTYSLKLALEHLGFGKCYHMLELFQKPNGVKHFWDAENGKSVNWEELFTGFDSAVDYPVARYYKQLAEFYPEAKVIHTIRNPEEWYESAKHTIFNAKNLDGIKLLKFAAKFPFSKEVRKRFKVFKYNRNLMDQEFGNDLTNKDKVIKAFIKHTENVKKEIPPERLLLYRSSEGWESLCRFLNVPVPDEEYPNRNSREEFLNRVDSIGTGKFIEPQKVI
ncbi:MAG TPA: sulfotransferase [Ignavibacteria bacterium]|nr:sulfotransferase [Ignavibacteria bacterium]